MAKRRRVLLVGHGCREAALATSLARDDAEIHSVARCRNPLIEQLSEDLHLVSRYTPESIVQYAASVKPDFVMVGPEDPIAAGATDALTSAGFWVCAPTRQASRLEWDKAHMREFLSVHVPSFNIPFLVVRDTSEVHRFFQNPSWPVAVKPVGLTGGKGVKVEGVQLRTPAETEAFANECLLRSHSRGAAKKYF
ncbi:MAG: hypothetical protein NTZ17_14425 [Phycisphaerae bacterium]|nr:hypothetical protein [Phycisphaerae bacterium]